MPKNRSVRLVVVLGQTRLLFYFSSNLEDRPTMGTHRPGPGRIRTGNVLVLGLPPHGRGRPTAADSPGELALGLAVRPDPPRGGMDANWSPG